MTADDDDDDDNDDDNDDDDDDNGYGMIHFDLIEVHEIHLGIF